MNKKQLLSIPALFAALVMSAQTYTGGVKGTVVDRSSKTAVDGAVLKLYSGAEEIAEVKTAPDGTFMIPSLKDGMYDLVIKTPDYLESRINVTVNDGYVKNMFKLSLTPARKVSEVDDASFTEFDLDDSGYQDSPTILSARTTCSTISQASISALCVSESAVTPASPRMSILQA